MWGGGWPAMKVGLRDLPPFLYLGGRQLIVGVFFLALAYWRHIRLPKGKNLVRSFGIGVVMTGVSNGLMFWGQQYISAGLASILFATMPFFTAGLAHLLLNERLNAWKVMGIAVGFAGVALLLSNGQSEQSPQAILGEAALVLSALCWALPLVLMKRWLGAEDPIALTGVQMLAGAVLLVPVGLMTEGIARVHPTASALLAFAYMTVGAGAIGFSTYYWLARQMAASRLVLTSFVVPGVAVVLGVLLLSEPAEPRLLLGLALIAAGIIVVNSLGTEKRGDVPATDGAATAVGSRG
jgi:drug/metabolite transporter (DMT)-like permease